MHKLNSISKKLLYIIFGVIVITISLYGLYLSSSSYQVIDLALGTEVSLLAISKLLYDLSKPAPKKYAWHRVYPVLRNHALMINKKATRINRFLFIGLGLFAIGFSFGLLSSMGFIVADLGILLIIISFYLNMHYTPPKTYNWELVFPELALGEIQEDEEIN